MTTTDTPDRTAADLNDLRAVAEAATPGPWGWRGSVDGLIELRGPGTYGPFDARIVSATTAEPCFAEIIDPDEDLDAYVPATTGAPTLHICDSCKEVWRKYQAGDGDAFDRYRCPKPDNLGTVWVNEPGHGHITPINRYATAQYRHRPDVGPGGVDHPNTRHIETFNPATVLALLDQVDQLWENLRRCVASLDDLIRYCDDPGTEALSALHCAHAVLSRGEHGMSEPAMHIIRRTDGGVLLGEYAFMVCDGPDDWTVPDADDPDDPTVYEILAVGPVVATRTFGEPDADEDDDLVPVALAADDDPGVYEVDAGDGA